MEQNINKKDGQFANKSDKPVAGQNVGLNKPQSDYRAPSTTSEEDKELDRQGKPIKPIGSEKDSTFKK